MALSALSGVRRRPWPDRQASNRCLRGKIARTGSCPIIVLGQISGILHEAGGQYRRSM
jgi:hypothetical protein